MNASMRADFIRRKLMRFGRWAFFVSRSERAETDSAKLQFAKTFLPKQGGTSSGAVACWIFIFRVKLDLASEKAEGALILPQDGRSSQLLQPTYDAAGRLGLDCGH